MLQPRILGFLRTAIILTRATKLRRRTILRLLVWALASVTLSHPAGAQLRCTIFDPSTANVQYHLFAFSASGNYCTAFAIRLDFAKFVSTSVFVRSNDGGKSWLVQDPGLGNTLSTIRVIDQIDSLNVVAVGDTGLVVRTTDGGSTWSVQMLPRKPKLEDVHFSDANVGIIAGADTVQAIFLTTDGGVHWTIAPFSRTFLWQCHSYGEGVFRLFKYSSGEIYTTRDNWKSVDSTEAIFDSLNDPKRLSVAAHCNFSGGDTMIAFGAHSPNSPHGLIVLSTDAGHRWEQPWTFDTSFGQISCMSGLDRDTILANGTNFGNSLEEVLLSTDRGLTWRKEPLLYDTAFPTDAYGIALSPDGAMIAAFGIPGESVLVRGAWAQSAVAQVMPLVNILSINPNPAAVKVTIRSDSPSLPIHLLDILGRTVLSGTLDERGAASLDVSSLPRGVYSVMIGRDGMMVPVGKVAVVGK